MTVDDIIRMAGEAGVEIWRASSNVAVEKKGIEKGYLEEGEVIGYAASLVEMRRYTALVAAAERERCAQICEDHHMSDGDWCAKQIRASA